MNRLKVVQWLGSIHGRAKLEDRGAVGHDREMKVGAGDVFAVDDGALATLLLDDKLGSSLTHVKINEELGDCLGLFLHHLLLLQLALLCGRFSLLLGFPLFSKFALLFGHFCHRKVLSQKEINQIINTLTKYHATNWRLLICKIHQQTQIIHQNCIPK